MHTTLKNLSLRSKVVWLTGASSGIGESLAVECARRGARVALTARRGEVLERLAESIRSRGGEASVHPGDVCDLEQMKSVAQRISETVAPVDILISNAGDHIFTKPEEFSSAEYLHLMNLNFGGQLRCIEAVLPSMLQRGRGRIAAMASLAGFRGLPRAAAYGASKAATIHFMESIRFHLKPLGVEVTIINPGFVKTPLTDKNDFKMPFLVSGEQAARSICDGLERGRSEISFPFLFAWFMKCTRILPYPIYEWAVTRVWNKMESGSK